MWMSLSASRWIGLLTLAGVMLICASQAKRNTNQPCCYGGNLWIKGPIESECLIQSARGSCISAYLVKPVGGWWRCIKKDSPWIQRKIDKGEIVCIDEFSILSRF